MFIALFLFAALGDPVGRLLKPSLVNRQGSRRVEYASDFAGPEATAL